jgi:hypothetical protein
MALEILYKFYSPLSGNVVFTATLFGRLLALFLLPLSLTNSTNSL